MRHASLFEGLSLKSPDVLGEMYGPADPLWVPQDARVARRSLVPELHFLHWPGKTAVPELRGHGDCKDL